MPMIHSRYPDNWEEISLRIRERDGNKCAHCGVENHRWIWRFIDDPFKYIYVTDEEGLYFNADNLQEKMVKIILTVHHIGVDYPDGRKGDCHDKMDCRDENLISLCQRCHFIADLPSHIVSARKSRITKKHARIQANGQQSLFED